MDEGLLKVVAGEVCSQVDWQRPELAELARCREGAEPIVAAFGLARHLRQRETPRLGYTQDYIQLLRSRANEEQRQKARERIEQALKQALVATAHSNPVTGVGAETLFIGADRGLCERIGDSVLAAREHWANGPWGTTRGICELLRRLMVLPECPDVTHVPLFGWLQTQIWNEWNWARTWGEQMLGSSGHNWWSHTFLGLFEAGLFFPEFKGFSRFR